MQRRGRADLATTDADQSAEFPGLASGKGLRPLSVPSSEPHRCLRSSLSLPVFPSAAAAALATTDAEPTRSRQFSSSTGSQQERYCLSVLILSRSVASSVIASLSPPPLSPLLASR